MAIDGGHDPMLSALVLTREHGACLEPDVTIELFVLPRAQNRLNPAPISVDQVAIDLAEFDFLESIGKAALQELPIVRRWVLPE